MRAAGIGAETTDHRARLPVLNSRQLPGLPKPIAAPVKRALAHERHDVLEGETGLPNDDATITVSDRGTASGPSSVAHATADRSAVLPFPRAIDSAAVPTPGANAPRSKPPLPGQNGQRSPARRPCVIVRPARYRSSSLIWRAPSASQSRGPSALGLHRRRANG